MRIRVDSCGVCFHEVVTRNGTLKRGVAMPLIPGHEVAGIVESVGPDVRGFRPGDRVARPCSGATSAATAATAATTRRHPAPSVSSWATPG